MTPWYETIRFVQDTAPQHRTSVVDSLLQQLLNQIAVDAVIATYDVVVDGELTLVRLVLEQDGGTDFIVCKLRGTDVQSYTQVIEVWDKSFSSSQMYYA